MREYGNAIRDLAIANIFPGDLLWRNFGVTRYGRVVFYDYDEIEYLTDCQLPPRSRRRRPPRPSSRPSRGTRSGRNDVFPEEFATFLLGDPRCARRSCATTPSCSSRSSGRTCQRRIAAGEIVDFFPYPESLRFSNRHDGRSAWSSSDAPDGLRVGELELRTVRTYVGLQNRIASARPRGRSRQSRRRRSAARRAPFDSLGAGSLDGRGACEVADVIPKAEHTHRSVLPVDRSPRRGSHRPSLRGRPTRER